MLFSPIFTKGIKAKLNELESESDIEGQRWETELLTEQTNSLVKPKQIQMWSSEVKISDFIDYKKHSQYVKNVTIEVQIHVF